MIHYKQGNLLSVSSGIIVHGCNAQGVMGSGVALAIKQRYPDCFKLYKQSISHELGKVHWWSKDSENLWIANAITQENYGRNKDIRYVNYAAITLAFIEIFRFANSYCKDVHFPKIGAGLANGDWEIIESLINDCDPNDDINKTCWVL